MIFREKYAFSFITNHIAIPDLKTLVFDRVG